MKQQLEWKADGRNRTDISSLEGRYPAQETAVFGHKSRSVHGSKGNGGGSNCPTDFNGRAS
jgi:hypothetical protein